VGIRAARTAVGAAQEDRLRICGLPTKVRVVTGACTSAKNSPPSKDRKKEIGRDLLAKMCRDLNIDPHDL
jgi:hypothetical protein